jgi:predicted esterase
MTSALRVRHVATPVHGRYLVRVPAGVSDGVLVGFHGYAETADAQFARLGALAAAGTWTLVSVQALHPFYRGRSQEVVASWMTRADRDLAIADNVAYVDRVLDELVGSSPTGPIVHAGFSQGAAMAYRAALRGKHPSAGVIAIGGDLPPDLTTFDAAAWRNLHVLVGRGADDDWFTQEKMDADVEWLTPRVASVQAVVVDAGHAWTSAFDPAVGRLLAQVTGPNPERP